ncbi:MAG: hypothetical protein Q4C95_02415 [Planctomycetia bacterium]|nr:hypothetical protein [Planctomycetia bacterium]
MVSFLFLFNLGLFSGIVSPKIVIPVTSGNVLMASESVEQQPNIRDSLETTEINNEISEFKLWVYLSRLSVFIGITFMFLIFEDFFTGMGIWH